jgi:hypothetical protein
MLLAYLDHPLNAPRHEALVKRLYKLAEDARDDEVIARFLLAFDRSVRRLRIDRVAQSAGHAPRPLTAVRPPHASTMPRETWALGKARKEPEKYRLFSLKTRNYLRRRAWRYFRLLGKADPARYRALMADLLPRYTDEDFRDGLALLDNWGFVHVLYHHSPALLSLPTGWTLVQGHRLAELAPAPIYPEVWQAAPDVILGLLAAPARPVRRWAIGLLKRDHAAVLAALPAGTLVGWLAHPSPEMVAFGVELLRARPGGLGSLPLEQWLALLEQAPPEALDHLLGLLGDHLRSAARSVGPAVRLASARSPSLAAFGFEVLRSLELNSEEECRAVLGLREAACETLRARVARRSLRRRAGGRLGVAGRRAPGSGRGVALAAAAGIALRRRPFAASGSTAIRSRGSLV